MLRKLLRRLGSISDFHNRFELYSTGLEFLNLYFKAMILQQVSRAEETLEDCDETGAMSIWRLTSIELSKMNAITDLHESSES
jgi:hypothetical protein